MRRKPPRTSDANADEAMRRIRRASQCMRVSFFRSGELRPRTDWGRRRRQHRQTWIAMRLPPFIHEVFLLETDTARDLNHGFAEALPIIDYHTHLPPQQIAENHRFRTLSEVWLEGDHYKWRAMRTNGVAERYCTGDASDWEKFEAWAKTVPETARNPRYHWTHMELKDPFGVPGLLNGNSARPIYARANRRLEEEGLHAQGLLRHFGVVVVCTTDHPTDSLEHHARYAEQGLPGPRLFPTWRPHKALAVEDLDRYNEWRDRLEVMADSAISTFETLLVAPL